MTDAPPSLGRQRLSLDDAHERVDHRTSRCDPPLSRSSVEGRIAIPPSRVHAVGGDRRVGVGGGDDPRLDRDRVAHQAVRVAASVDMLVVVPDGGRGRRDLVDPRTMPSPSSTWPRMTSHSSGSSGPRLSRMSSGMLAFPMSCSQPPSRQRWTASGRPSSPRRRGQIGDLLAVQLGDALARAGEQREALRDAHGLGLVALEVALVRSPTRQTRFRPRRLAAYNARSAATAAIAGQEARAALGRADRDRDGDRTPDDHRCVADARPHSSPSSRRPIPAALHAPAPRAPPRRGARRARARRRSPSSAAELDQHLVAGLVSVRVVDPLEPVDVEQQHAGADRAVRA